MKRAFAQNRNHDRINDTSMLIFQLYVVLDGHRSSDVDVSRTVSGGRDRLAGLPSRPRLTRAVHGTSSRRATVVVVPADDQQLRDHQHDDVHARPAVVVRRPSAHARAQPVGQILLARSGNCVFRMRR